MADRLVLGVDCSTTSAKCIAWDVRGRAVAEGRASFGLSNPSVGGYEQDAEDWWRAVVEAVSAVTAEVDSGRIEGLCIAHQRETFVVTDLAGRPKRPAIVWMDERCGAQVQRAKDRDDAIHEASGKPVCMTPSVHKIAWLRETEPGIFDGDVKVVDVHAFLLRRVLGRWVTSTASADPMGLVDMRSGDWSALLMGLASLRREQMPALVAPGACVGGVSASAAGALGVRAGLPVFAGAGDGQAAGLGAGITGPGRAYLNLGTAVVSGVWSGVYRTDRAFRTLFGAAPGSFFLETDLKGGTFTINWLLERWLGDGDREAILRGLSEAAAGMGPGSEGLMLVPYWCGVMNPHWDDDAAGIVLGWRGHHGPAHLYRAILEGIAFEQRLHTDGVEKATGEAIETFVVMGGGATSDLWCQIVADVTGRVVERASSTEATALGAGILAAVGAGLHADIASATAAMTACGRRFEPGPDRAAYDALFRDVYEGLYPALQGAMGRLSALGGVG